MLNILVNDTDVPFVYKKVIFTQVLLDFMEV